MTWLRTLSPTKFPILALMLVLSGANCRGGAASDISRPLAQAHVTTEADVARISEVAGAFADRNNFAPQRANAFAQGNLEFEMRLYRDDLSIFLSRLRGQPLEIAAHPLCACESGRRQGLQRAADESIRELREELSRP